MKFFTIASSFLAAASAVDIRLWTGSNCTGAYVACVNINANTCCSSGNTRFPSIGLVAIPSSWMVQLRTYENGSCNALRKIQGSGGATKLCFSEADGIARISGGGWDFTGKRRDEDNDATCSATGCTSTVKPDILVLEDAKTTFGLADMEESLFESL